MGDDLGTREAFPDAMEDEGSDLRMADDVSRSIGEQNGFDLFVMEMNRVEVSEPMTKGKPDPDPVSVVGCLCLRRSGAGSAERRYC